MNRRNWLHRILPALVTGMALLTIFPAHAAQVRSDFNGDGYADLAIGVPDETLGTEIGAGAVHILYGTASGLKTLNPQFWTQNSPGIPGTSKFGDHFGEVLASGDFNQDGFADLAIGVPGKEATQSTPDAGVVHVLYGTPTGLTGTATQLWSQDTPNIADGSEAGDHFGLSLAAGDYNQDGCDDLVIGVPRENLWNFRDAGAVHVLFGRPGPLALVPLSTGLKATGSLWLTQTDFFSVMACDPECPLFEEGDGFGTTLAFGKGFLAIGVPFEDIGGKKDAGAVHTIAVRNRTGLPPVVTKTFWHQGRPGTAPVVGAAETEDYFGSEMTAGDFNGDGMSDLAVGVDDEDIGNKVNVGGVHVFFGAAFGPTAVNNRFLHQDLAAVAGSAATNTYFGRSLAAGNFDNDVQDELVVGAPLERLPSFPGDIYSWGKVHVLDLKTATDQVWHRDIPGVLGESSSYNFFGNAVTVADWNGDGRMDLAIGAPGESVGSVSDAGVMNAIYSGPSGLTTAGNQLWSQDSPGMPDTSEPSEWFGNVLSGNHFMLWNVLF